MREIKFRAWDIEKQDWIYFRIDLFPSEPQTIKLPKQLKIQRGTGLKDKNGKEIYEGDIVKHDSLNYEVVWPEKYITDDNEDLLAYALDEHKNGLRGMDVQLWYEIIGNIYENPELLPNQEK